jgi:hypothetical protein
MWKVRLYHYFQPVCPDFLNLAPGGPLKAVRLFLLVSLNLTAMPGGLPEAN